MDNNNLSNSKKSVLDKSRPSLGAFVLIALLLAAFSAIMFISVRVADVVLLVPFFALAAAILTYLLYFVRNPFVLLIPCAASFICIPHFLPGLICLSALMMCSGVFALILMHRTESFRFFMVGALMYSVITGAVFVLLMLKTFGDITVGLEYLANLSVKLVQNATQGMDEKYVTAAVDMARTVPMVIPSVIFCVGIFAAWITKWTLSGVASLSGMKKRLFSRITGAPAALAVVFILLTLSGLLFALSSERTYYAYANIQSILSIIFMGEGVRELILLFRKPGAERRKFMFVIIAVALVMFASSMVVNIAAFYGAYRTIFKRIHVIKIPKE